MTKPNDNSVSQNGLGQEFQDILNNGQQTGQGNGNDVQIPNQPTIVQGGSTSDVPNQPTLVHGGGVETATSTIAPTAASIDPDSDEAGAEFGLDVNTTKALFSDFC